MNKNSRMIMLQYPGAQFTEQIMKPDGKLVYACYTPPIPLYDSKSPNYHENCKKRLAGLHVEPDGWESEKIEYKERLPAPQQNERDEFYYIPLQKCPWFLSGPPVEPGDNLYEDIRSFIYDHVDFVDPRAYDLFTAWTFATYIPEAFTTLGYIFLQGALASGKTRALEVLNSLCYRSVLASNVTEAAIYQVIQDWKVTLILDEVERYNREKYSTVQQLLNSGYRRGQTVIRGSKTEDGKRTPETFDVYGFKALAGTEGLLPTLESRSIITHMIKTSRKVNFLLEFKRAAELRSRLLMWRFRALYNIEQHEKAFSEESPEALKFGNGRFIELFACLYAVHPKARDPIISFAKDMLQDYETEEETSTEAQLISAICKCRPRNKEVKFLTQDVASYFNQDIDASEQLTANTVGKIIRNLGFKKYRSSVARGWKWDENLVRRQVIRYKVPEEIYGRPLKTSQSDLDSVNNHHNDINDVCDA